MIVSAINNTEQIKYPGFRGNVSNAITSYISDGIKKDCHTYSETIIKNGETVNPKNLEAIKDIWINLWEILKEKAALMHKDTTINVRKVTEGSDYGSTKTLKYDLIIKNNKLDETLEFPNMYNSEDHDIIQHKRLENFTKNLCPKDTDKEILKKYSYKLLRETYQENLPFLKQNYEKLLEYKNEIKLDERLDVIEKINMNIKKLSDKEFMKNMQYNERYYTDKIIYDLLKDIK